MTPSRYRNRGVGWTRADGSRVERGQVFVPTEEERLRKAYKLEYVGPAVDAEVSPPAVVSEPEDRWDEKVEEYAIGKGRYMVHGEEMDREQAVEALRHGDED